jgi:hypothetical protein
MTESTGPRAIWKHPLARGLVVLLAYLAAAVVMTWPTVMRPGQYVLGEEMDAVTAFYNLWWFQYALCHLHTGFWTSPLMDYPHGYSMIFFPMWVPYDAIALPWVHHFGIDAVPVVYNFIGLLAFAACGLAAFVFVRHLTRDPGAAFVAGLALAFMPYRFWNLTRWHVSCLELVAPCLYFFLRLVRDDRPSRWTWAGLGGFAALLAYTSPSYAVDVALALGMMLAVMSVTERDRVRSRAFWLALAKASALALALGAPLLIRVGLEVMRQPLPLAQDEALRQTYSANLLGFVMPGFNLRAFAAFTAHSALADAGLTRAHATMGYEIFLGYAVILLAAVGAVTGRKPALPFVALAAGFLLLALGPAVHIGSYTTAAAAPYAWLQRIMPLLRLERAPVRHAGIAFVALAVLAGLGLSRLGAGLTSRRRLALNLAAGATVLLEFWQAPLNLTRLPIPPFVAEIKADPVPGSVLDLPFLPAIPRFGGTYQTHHERPLAIQLTRRVDDPAYQASALFRYLDRPRVWLNLAGEKRSAALSELQAEFQQRQIRYVIVYKKFMGPEDVAGMRSLMKDYPRSVVMIEDDHYLVYCLD